MRLLSASRSRGERDRDDGGADRPYATAAMMSAGGRGQRAQHVLRYLAEPFTLREGADRDSCDLRGGPVVDDRHCVLAAECGQAVIPVGAGGGPIGDAAGGVGDGPGGGQRGTIDHRRVVVDG